MPFEYIEPEQNISITTLASLYKPESVTPRQLPFADAVKLFCGFVQATRKDAVPMYSGAVYGSTLYREDKNVIGMAAAVIDFDNSIDKKPSASFTFPEDQHDNLSGLTYFWHSTFSSTSDWCKWRLIIPLDRQATLEEWPYVVQGVIELLGGKDPNIDFSCFELSRAFYVPSYPAAHKAAAFSGYSDGKEVFNVTP